MYNYIEYYKSVKNKLPATRFKRENKIFLDYESLKSIKIIKVESGVVVNIYY